MAPPLPCLTDKHRCLQSLCFTVLATEHPSPATLDVDECASGATGEGGAAGKAVRKAEEEHFSVKAEERRFWEFDVVDLSQRADCSQKTEAKRRSASAFGCSPRPRRRCASGAAGGAVRKAGERQEATAIVPPASSTGSAKDAPASRQDPAVASISTLAKESADSRGHEFGSQHLALVLRAAFPSKVAMRKFVQEVKATSEAFKAVQLSSQANGGKYSKYSPEQIAANIAECRPEQVASAAQLLSWLTVRHTPKAVRIRS